MDQNDQLDPQKLDLVGRMGSSWYTRSGESLFEIPKPLRSKGIGVDQLPKHIRESNVLTGNNLGRLGNMERFPNDQEIRQVAQFAEVRLTFTKTEFHQLAQHILEQGDPQKAFSVLMYAQKYHD